MQPTTTQPTTTDSRTLPDGWTLANQPAPDSDPARFHRGTCPDCGKHPLVSNLYYVEGKGYLLVWECEGSLSESPTCAYRRVL